MGMKNPLIFSPGGVTIFVGPNNAGKSLLLREIENFCNNGLDANSIILDKLSFSYPDDDQILSLINSHEIPFKQGERQEAGHVRYGKINSAKGFLQRIVLPENLLDWKKIISKIFVLSS